jgi:hypothetical protein
MRRRLELVAGPFRASWRAGLGWSIVFALMIVGTVAFWPAFQGSEGLKEAFGQLPPALLEAFGLEDFGSPAGYLKGGLYDVVIPLMFAAAGAARQRATAGEEDAGRLELWLTQPVTRRGPRPHRRRPRLARVLALVVSSRSSCRTPPRARDRRRADRRHGAPDAAGRVVRGPCDRRRRSRRAAGDRPLLGLGLALVGYLVAALFPLSSVLEAWAGSPCDCARRRPALNPTEAPR